MDASTLELYLSKIESLLLHSSYKASLIRSNPLDILKTCLNHPSIEVQLACLHLIDKLLSKETTTTVIAVIKTHFHDRLAKLWKESQATAEADPRIEKTLSSIMLKMMSLDKLRDNEHLFETKDIMKVYQEESSKFKAMFQPYALYAPQAAKCKELKDKYDQSLIKMKELKAWGGRNSLKTTWIRSMTNRNRYMSQDAPKILTIEGKPYTVTKTPRDGNCGFTALGTDRRSLTRCLKTHRKDAAYRSLIALEIFNDVKSGISEIQMQCYQFTTFQKSLVKRFQIAFADQTPGHEERFTALSDEVLAFCQTEEVYVNYLTYLEKNSSAWLGHYSMQCYAMDRDMNLKVYGQDTTGQFGIVLQHQEIYEYPGLGGVNDTVHILYTDGNHYQRLEDAEAPARQKRRTSEPSEISDLKALFEDPRLSDIPFADKPSGHKYRLFNITAGCIALFLPNDDETEELTDSESLSQMNSL